MMPRFHVYTESTQDENAFSMDSLHNRCLNAAAEHFARLNQKWRVVSINTYVRRNYHGYAATYVTVIAEALEANVYSDWLDDRGYNDAAAALRKAFPLATGE